MSTGLRVGDGAKLRLDCIVRDGQGAPYLRYTNHKMRREAFVPIDTTLTEAIIAQQQKMIDEYGDPAVLLPAAPAIPTARSLSAPPPSAASSANGYASATSATNTAA